MKICSAIVDISMVPVEVPIDCFWGMSPDVWHSHSHGFSSQWVRPDTTVGSRKINRKFILCSVALLNWHINMCFVRITLLVSLLLGCTAKKLVHSNCYSTKIRTEILSHNNTFEIFHLPKINVGKLKFNSLLKICTELKHFLACSPYTFNNLGFMPFN